MSGLSNNLPVVIYLIAALLVALTASTLFDFVFAASPAMKNRKVFAAVNGASHHLDGQVSLDDYITVLPDRFCGYTSGRTPFKRRKGAGLEAVYVLRGTAIHSDPALSRAFIEVPGVSAQQAYRPGDDVHGARLVRIENDHVEMKKGQQAIRIDVSFDVDAPVGFGQQNPGDRSLEEMLKKLPPAARKLMNRATPQQRQHVMNLPPAERMRALRTYLRKQQQAEKKKKRANAKKRKKAQ